MTLFRPQLALPLALTLAAPSLALAQDGGQAKAQGPEAEIAELQRLLARVDAALEQLRAVTEPEVTFAQYDLRHLLWVPVDRVPPSLTIPGDPAGSRTGAGTGGVFSFDDDAEECGLDGDGIETLITEVVGEDNWDDPRSLEINDGYLLVNQTAVGHARIAGLLAQLKARESRTVQLEVGFYALSDALQAKIEGAAAGGKGSLPPAVLTQLDQAVARGEAKLTGSAMLTSLDEQRVFLHQGAEQAFVSDFEQSSGGTGNVVAQVADPIVEVLMSGLTLDVRPTIVGEGRRPFVSLDVRFVRSRPLELAHSKTPWGSIDIPRVAVDSVRTSARVPSGGGMLVFSARASADATQPDVTIIVRPLVVGDQDR
jgi:hypothetical protein